MTEVVAQTTAVQVVAVVLLEVAGLVVAELIADTRCTLASRVVVTILIRTEIRLMSIALIAIVSIWDTEGHIIERMGLS